MSEQDVPDGPISREEMIDLFGEEMPMEAVKLVWEVPGHMTLREVRQELRRIAMTLPQNPRVTQADKQAAEAFWMAHGPFAWGTVATLYYAFARHREAAEAASKAREAALVEALTPSGDTKAAYHGEFSFQLFRGESDAGIDQYEKVCVPWTTVKEIMAAISARAALSGSQP